MNFEDFVSGPDLVTILPLLIVVTLASVLLIVDLFIPKTQKPVSGWLAVGGLLTALVVAVLQGPLNLTGLGLAVDRTLTSTTAFNNMVRFDGLTYSFNVLALLTGIVGIMLAISAFKRFDFNRWLGEYHVLILFTISGMMLLGAANDLIVVFVGIELLSIPLYILAGFYRPRTDSEEAAMKYFLLGAFASGFLVYGIALTYGATNTTSLPLIAQTTTTVLSATGAPNLLLLMGLGLILVGLGFKVAAVPFHMWTPDVYQGAPTVLTAFMSVGAKTAGFAAILRVFYIAFLPIISTWAPLMALLAAATMIVGNVLAVVQNNIKRMLAYSAIAHAGYILMAFVAGGSLVGRAAEAAMIYIVAYAVSNLGAWAIVAALETAPGEHNNIDDFAGLGQRRPRLAFAMTLFMLSFTGIPLTIGFLGKFVVFSVAIEAGYMWLAVVGVLTSVISAFYYLRVIVVMWMRPSDGAPLNVPATFSITALTTGVLTLIFGVLPNLLFGLAATVLGAF